MMEKISFKKLSEIFGYLFFLVLPFQINFIFFGQELYSSAFFNPFLSHSIYLGDIFLFGSFLFLALGWAFGEKLEFKIWDKKLLVLIGFFLFSILLSLIFSVNFWNSFFYFLRFLEFFGLYFLIVFGILKFEKMLVIFICSVFFQALLGICQFFVQSSIGLGFLGEPVVNDSLTGVAKFTLFGEKILRSYGTFPHPNIFGAYLAFGILFSFYLLKNKEIGTKLRKFLWLNLGLFLLALVLTFSRSAILALLIGGGFYLISILKNSKPLKTSSKMLVCFVVLVLSYVLVKRFFAYDSGLEERLLFFKVSKNMFLENPMGVGIGNFTQVMQQYTATELLPWNFQPVHNVYLLVLNEIGIVGFFSFLSLLGYSFWNSRVKTFLLSCFLMILTLGFFDHYLLTLYQGQVLLFLFFSFVQINRL